MTPDDLFADFEAQFSDRKFAAGLLIAMIDFLEELGAPEMAADRFADVLAKHPRQAMTAQGKRANTLIVELGDRTLSLRPFYNAAERLFYDHKRFDYPSCAPHATQAWTQYERWLDALSRSSREELHGLRRRVVDFVLAELPSHEFDPASVRVAPPVFRLLLEELDFVARKGEPSGAAYQGVVFGFLRADNPHLQVEVDKVRTGSRRRDRVGDIDGWEGQRLAITAEVKQTLLEERQMGRLKPFASEATRRGAIGLVVALSFGDGAREAVEEIGLRALDVEDLIRIVSLWDPVKQRTAVESMMYYVAHVERNSQLRERLAAYLQEVENRGKES